VTSALATPECSQCRDVTRQITSGMQDVDDDDLVRLIQKHQEMLPCSEISQVFGIIDQDGTAPAVSLTIHYRFASGKKFGFVNAGLTRPERFNGPSGDLNQAVFRAAREPERSAHGACRALAKARLTASSPLPSAKLPHSA